MSKISQKLGNKGEEMALDKYLNNGYKLVKRNFQYFSKGVKGRIGEIDLIVIRFINNIVNIRFIEVKTRSNNRFDLPVSQISEKKINSISLSSDKFIYEINNNLVEFCESQNIDLNLFKAVEIDKIVYNFDLVSIVRGEIEIIPNFV